MPFLPTADQRDLQQGIRDLLVDRWPVGGLVEVADAGTAGVVEATSRLWESLTEAGVFDVRSELGLGWADAVLIFEELGRALVPGPLVATVLARDLPVDARGAVCLVEAGPSPLLVAHADQAGAALVLAEDGVAVVDTDRLDAEPLERPVDPLTPLHRIERLPDVSPLDAGAASVRRQGAVLTAALQAGLALRLVELSVDYAKTREQFDRPVGGFQAVKHLCADMYARAELARVAVEAAGVLLDDPGSGDPDRAAAGAKLLADEAATTNGRAAIQVHGGIGFTWELPLHLFLKRAWFHAAEWGTADVLSEQVAQAL